jgi:hypothetical protein
MNSQGYRVIWRRQVIESRIAGFMLELMNRNESTAPLIRAMNRIDEVLRLDPNNSGESRADFERIYFEPPLSVTYEVHEDERVVIVLRARYFRPRHDRR